MDLKERFLKYVSFDTQSDETSTSFPSTDKQLVLLKHLKEELEAIGLTEVTMDEYGYVMATLPATKGKENVPTIGFISHVDTSPDMSGANVKPHVIDSYDGRDIRLGNDVWLKVEEFPELSFFKGHTLIHTDGTTLLGSLALRRARVLPTRTEGEKAGNKSKLRSIIVALAACLLIAASIVVIFVVLGGKITFGV